MMWIITCFAIVALCVIVMAYNRPLPPEGETNGGCAILCVLLICLGITIASIYALIKCYPL